MDCRQGADGADVAGKKFPLSDPQHFRSLLESQVSGLTMPHHSGVTSAVVKEENASAGYVVTLVPAASSMPLQVAGDYKYYMRAGSKFVPIPHPLLAGMFGKKPTPELFIDVSPAGDAQYRERGDLFVHAEIDLRNESSGIAEGIYMTVEIQAPNGCESGTEVLLRGDYARANQHRGVASVTTDNSFKVPPGTSIRVFNFYLLLKEYPHTDLVIRVSAGSANRPPVFQELRTSKNKLMHTMQLNLSGNVTLDRNWLARRTIGLEKD